MQDVGGACIRSPAQHLPVDAQKAHPHHHNAFRMVDGYKLTVPHHLIATHTRTPTHIHSYTSSLSHQGPTTHKCAPRKRPTRHTATGTTTSIKCKAQTPCLNRSTPQWRGIAHHASAAKPQNLPAGPPETTRQ